MHPMLLKASKRQDSITNNYSHTQSHCQEALSNRDFNITRLQWVECRRNAGLWRQSSTNSTKQQQNKQHKQHKQQQNTSLGNSSAAVSLHNAAVVQSAVKSALDWFSDETHYCSTNGSFSDHSMHRGWVLVPPNLAVQNTPAQKWEISYRIPLLKKWEISYRIPSLKKTQTFLLICVCVCDNDDQLKYV